MTVICRFAPSPTGRLHVGNVRTALMNWLFVRERGHASEVVKIGTKNFGKDRRYPITNGYRDEV